MPNRTIPTKKIAMQSCRLRTTIILGQSEWMNSRMEVRTRKTLHSSGSGSVHTCEKYKSSLGLTRTVINCQRETGSHLSTSPAIYTVFFFTSTTHQHILFATFLNCDVFFWCCIHVCHCFSFFMLHKRNVHKAFKSYFEMCIYKVHISKATLTALFRIKTFFASDTLQEYHMQTLHNSSPNETEQDMLILQHPDLLHWLQAERLLDWNIITFLLFFKHNSFVFICRILLVTNHHNLFK
jgi:hypothetical protein